MIEEASAYKIMPQDINLSHSKNNFLEIKSLKAHSVTLTSPHPGA